MLKKYRWILLLILIPVLLIAALQVPWGSSVERTILPEIEFDAESVPRNPSGRIDFVRILDDASYLPPEENCLVDIARLFGTDMDPTPPDILQALGNPTILAKGDRIPELVTFYRESNPGATEEQFDAFLDIYVQSWTADDLPLSKIWVEQYGELIDELHAASMKKGYYHPYRIQGDGLLINALLPAVHKMRSAARVLNDRAKYHLGNGNKQAAMKDLIAINSLAIKLNRAPLLVEQMVGAAMHGVGHSGVCELLGHQLSQDQLRQLQREFSADQTQSISYETASSEKLFALDLIDMAAKGGFRGDDVGLELDPRLQFLLAMRSTVDWEVSAKIFIEFYDKIERASKSASEQERMQQMRQALDDIEKARNDIKGSGVAFRMFVGARSRGMIAGQLLMEFMIPALDSIGAGLIRQQIQRELIGVATAIERFKIDNDRYPQNLEQLVPEFLETIPTDRFNGGPVNYAITDTHYFIASAGADGKNDLPALIDLADPKDEHKFDDSRSWVKVKLK